MRPGRDPRGAGRPILVWDAPLRVFHGLLVASFVGAWLTAEQESWRLTHVTLGYTLAGLLVFRLAWGLIGTRHARFAAFVRAPSAAWRYLRSLRSGQPEHHVGHNPAGALAIVGLLALGVATTVLGWATYEKVGGGGEWLADAHAAAAQGMLGLVALHLAGVVVGSWVHRENLVVAMLTGRKRGAPQQAIRHSFRAVALVLPLAAGMFWCWQFLA